MGKIAGEVVPVLSIVVAVGGTAYAAASQGDDIIEIIKKSSFEGVNEFSGANDLKFAFEIVYVGGSDIVYHTFIPEPTGVHVKFLRQFTSAGTGNPVDDDDPHFRWLVDLVNQKIKDTLVE